MISKICYKIIKDKRKKAKENTPTYKHSNSKYLFGRLYPPSVPAFFFFEKKEKELHSSRGALRQD
jgi:hypothetical protein